MTNYFPDPDVVPQRPARTKSVSRAKIAVVTLVIIAILGGGLGLVSLINDDTPLPQPTAAAIGNSTGKVGSWFGEQVIEGKKVPESISVPDGLGGMTSGRIESVAYMNELPAGFTCPGGKVINFAYQAEPNTHAFGPDQRDKIHTAKDVLNRLKEKSCDSVFTVGTNDFLKDPNGGKGIDQEAIYDKASHLNGEGWKATVASIANQIDVIYVADLNVSYESAGMIPGANPGELPRLTKWSDRPVLGKTAIIVLKNGEHRLLRIECDLQWSVVKFTKLPAVQRFQPVGGPPKTVVKPPPPPRTTVTPPPPTSTPPPPPPPPPPCEECCEDQCPPPPPEVCPPGMHGTPPVCKDDVNNGPGQVVDVPQRPNPLPALPELEEPDAPDVPKPTAPYTPPAEAPATPVPVDQGGPTAIPTPRETLPPEPEQPTEEEPEEQCIPAPGAPCE